MKKKKAAITVYIVAVICLLGLIGLLVYSRVSGRSSEETMNFTLEDAATLALAVLLCLKIIFVLMKILLLILKLLLLFLLFLLFRKVKEIKKMMLILNLHFQQEMHCNHSIIAV